MTIYILFICQVLAFSEFPIGTSIRKPARNLTKENFVVGLIIVLTRLPEVDMLHIEFAKIEQISCGSQGFKFLYVNLRAFDHYKPF